MYNSSRKTLRIIRKLLNATTKNPNSTCQRPSMNERLRANLELDCMRQIREKIKKIKKYPRKESIETESYLFTSFDDMIFTELLAAKFKAQLTRLMRSIKKFKIQRQEMELTKSAYEQKKRLIAEFLKSDSKQKRDELKLKLVSGIVSL